MNNTFTSNYNENCRQHKQNTLWQFGRQNLSEQKKNQQFIFLIFFANFFAAKNTKSGHDSNPRLKGTKAIVLPRSQGGNNLEDIKRREVKRSQQVI